MFCFLEYSTQFCQLSKVLSYSLYSCGGKTFLSSNCHSDWQILCDLFTGTKQRTTLLLHTYRSIAEFVGSPPNFPYLTLLIMPHMHYICVLLLWVVQVRSKVGVDLLMFVGKSCILPFIGEWESNFWITEKVVHFMLILLSISIFL